MFCVYQPSNVNTACYKLIMNYFCSRKKKLSLFLFFINVFFIVSIFLLNKKSFLEYHLPRWEFML